MMTTRFLLAVLCILVTAAPASAECAWILWLKERDTYVPTASFDARRPCIENIASLASSAKEKDNLIFVGAGIVRYKTDDGSVTMVQCFPDTVDPRGPKGK